MKKAISSQNVFLDLITSRGFVGHKIRKNYNRRGLHPSMTFFVIGDRNKLSFFDIRNTIKALVKGFSLVASILKGKGHILIVNTDPELSSLVRHFATKTGQFGKQLTFCNSKWVGGTLTNWDQVSSSITTFLSFSKKFDRFLVHHAIYFAQYNTLKKNFQGFLYSQQDHDRKSCRTSFDDSLLNGAQRTVSKKNQQVSDNLWLNQRGNLGSLQPPEKKLDFQKPDLLIILNPNENRTALREANLLNIPVIALTDTSSNRNGIQYPIPVNSYSPAFIHLFFSWFLRIIKSL